MIHDSFAMIALTGVNSVLILMVGVLLKLSIEDIKIRILRIENLFLHRTHIKE